jgi:hypothetical protein
VRRCKCHGRGTINRVFRNVAGVLSATTTPKQNKLSNYEKIQLQQGEDEVQVKLSGDSCMAK